MTRRPRFPSPRMRGFTLVEAVVAIVLVGILAGIVAFFIQAPVASYRDLADRAALSDQADLALRRIARDVRQALPNSVRVSAAGDHLELLLTRSGGRYLTEDDGVAPALALSFDAAKNDFTVLAPPSSFADVRARDHVVVYNLGPGFEPANAYALADTGADPARPCAVAASAAGNIACISAVTRYTETIDGQPVPAVKLSMAGNPFARQPLALSSPDQRFQVISGPVSYYCAALPDGRLGLWRAWGYPIVAEQALPPANAQRALLASGLVGCDALFDYQTAASQRTGLVRIALGLQGRDPGAARIRLVHQAHVDNTP